MIEDFCNRWSKHILLLTFKAGIWTKKYFVLEIFYWKMCNDLTLQLKLMAPISRPLSIQIPNTTHEIAEKLNVLHTRIHKKIKTAWLCQETIYRSLISLRKFILCNTKSGLYITTVIGKDCNWCKMNQPKCSDSPKKERLCCQFGGIINEFSTLNFYQESKRVRSTTCQTEEFSSIKMARIGKS